MIRKLNVLLIVLGLFFMGYGAYRGKIAKVFIKAINICLECIGIG